MRILQLHSENIKRLKVVDITPKDDIVIISGCNENGKTSVIDSIWLALAHKGASKDNPSPIHAGEKSGLITVDLGNYIVTRKFTASGTTLEVRTPDNSKITSPQKLLDGLVGELSFDPWEFARKNNKDQCQMLADLLFTITNGQTNLADFENRKTTVSILRTDANRERKRVATLLTQFVVPSPQEPAEEVQAEDLVSSINKALELKIAVDDAKTKAGLLQKRINDLENELNEARQQYKTVANFLETAPKVPNLDLLQEDLKNLQQKNKRAREIQEYNKLRDGLTLMDETIEELNESIELIDIEYAEALENSPLPVKGLYITPDGLMITTQGGQLIPFCQGSAAQKLRISLGIAMAANPKLRVIRIADGSLLDDSSMKIIKDMAGDQDFQVWIEYASRNDKDRMGVYIEDGTVA